VSFFFILVFFTRRLLTSRFNSFFEGDAFAEDGVAAGDGWPDDGVVGIA
jgi:hypothetical protein